MEIATVWRLGPFRCHNLLKKLRECVRRPLLVSRRTAGPDAEHDAATVPQVGLSDIRAEPRETRRPVVALDLADGHVLPKHPLNLPKRSKICPKYSKMESQNIAKLSPNLVPR